MTERWRNRKMIIFGTLQAMAGRESVETVLPVYMFLSTHTRTRGDRGAKRHHFAGRGKERTHRVRGDGDL